MLILQQSIVVPFIILVVQLLKPYKRYYKHHNVIALLLALIGTAAIVVYNMTEQQFYAMNSFQWIRFSIESVILGMGSFLSAGKAYDMIRDRRKNNGNGKSKTTKIKQ